jgi:hypothetical protein
MVAYLNIQTFIERYEIEKTTSKEMKMKTLFG